MVQYDVTVFTGDLAWAGTSNSVYIKLVGTEGESERTHLWKLLHTPFHSGAKSEFTVSCPTSLGDLVLIELDKQSYFHDDAWYPAKVEVTSPEDKTYHFPIYHWITDIEMHYFREGTAKIDDGSPLPGGYSRQQELEQERKVYCWDIYEEGIPHCIKGKAASLPDDVRFSITKKKEMAYNYVTGLVELELLEYAECKKKFTCMDGISRLFFLHRTPISEYVSHHWDDDAFFGYQYLNGVNPLVIRRCTALPENFPVTDQMVFTHSQSSLTDEMKNGNIFLCDYKLLDGVPANTINGKKQYLMAPLVLLWKTNNDELTPIAIQLKQKPAEDNPIFVPTDSKDDWLLAKIFVRSADFNLYELSAHLLRTHLLAEVFAMSLLRNLPMVHPLYKLLIPHTRYTLQINALAREKLMSEDGVFTQFAACGGEGAIQILQRSLDSLTYSSLCIPEDIAERGLNDVPNFYYRDDGLKLWEIIHSFVSAVLGHYYETDDEVQHDAELQTWIHDIYEHGFLSKERTGIPQEFTTVDEMVKFVTMVIFTGSAQHSAVNTGQYDFGGWMPNYPTSMELPPPTKKGDASETRILNTLPDVSTTVHGMGTVWLLSRPSADSVFLGHYPNEHFSEEFPLQKIQEFQDALKKLSADIKDRNKKLSLPYTYLDPGVIENSVSI
ncbi:arachidonate 15-lipoxygenase B-like [Archocentrus centrarchus]|uniref:arachidonate 15-lipoxygenase B-like n=1 Tax=Archocentrus centrarchus TaxID=63155 RepID=UPI0011EA449E|nr:arachidonate 15-lipoxygenase B-like [Archocentrus centrarchus]